jgi:tetratricopeptide (TPR) repeat protein
MRKSQRHSLNEGDFGSPSDVSPGELRLPEAPASETGPVKVWEQPVLMRTWEPAKPDRNPLFLEKRVYQGSSGKVYPLPVIDRIETEPRDRFWKALHLENEYVRFMVLPEIGGRIHVGLDKLNGYDFFYRQNVIKPALVGLAGPWISGGVEFNWPQHHRPATFMPVEYSIEREPDGSATIWCSDHDPMSRMKGMHGLRLPPGRAFLELRVRLYNRTTDTQTFLWWANVATHVHEQYQSFFPRDVHYVADHAKRATTEFPLSRGKYYGVNYGDRRVHGVPQEELPRQFIPDGSYPVNDLSWYANIPVPTSYMIPASNQDFFGGYDHRRRAGVVHVADHHIAPGKKQWTWGNHDFGYAWDRHLTEHDGPYIELMAGVYTDNQPDFSYLAPGETKTFSQFWYPIREIGVPDYGNLDAAVRVVRGEGSLQVQLLVTSARAESSLTVYVDEKPAGLWEGDLKPESPLRFDVQTGPGRLEIVLAQGGQTLLHYAPDSIVPMPEPEVAKEPPLPADANTSDELFLTGLHLEQYRHPTRHAEDYWREAIRRDSRDSRANAALGRWHLRRGEFLLAEQHLRTAIARVTERNPNPADCEPFYNLGLALSYTGRYEESYAAFYKATWAAAWRAAGHHRLAELNCARGEWPAALEHIDRSLRVDLDNLNARDLRCLILRKLGRNTEAESEVHAIQALDQLDIFSRFLVSGEPPENGQQRLDVIFDLLRSGFSEEALSIARPPQSDAPDGSGPMLLYARAHILSRLGKHEEENAIRAEAAKADSDYVFPHRLEEMLLLEDAMASNPEDDRAPYYLGNLLYDRRRHREAIAMWERSVGLDPAFPTAWRNLGFGYYNILHDPERALEAFARARALAPDDARILYEQDQLKKRTGGSSTERLAELEANRGLVMCRDDLSVELATLYNDVSRPDAALAIFRGRQFQPWEGGEGLVLTQFLRSNLLLAQAALASGDAQRALRYLQNTFELPDTLGEARHLLINLSVVDYWMGVAYRELGFMDKAIDHWERAVHQSGDFRHMETQGSISEMTYWSAISLRQLGKEDEARGLLQQILDYAFSLDSRMPSIDYFATSLPAMLLFDEDLKQRQTITACFLKAQAMIGLGQTQEGIFLLNEVLKMDQSHSVAIDLLREQGK